MKKELAVYEAIALTAAVMVATVLFVHVGFALFEFLTK